MEDAPEDAVLVGLSMGAAAATWLALHRPGCPGVAQLHGAVPPHTDAGHPDHRPDQAAALTSSLLTWLRER